MKSWYGNLPEDSILKRPIKRLLDSGFIRYARAKDGEIYFIITPAGRIAYAKTIRDLVRPTTTQTQKI